MMPPGIFNLLDDIFGDEAVNSGRSKTREDVPAINVKESDKAFQIEMAVPGMKKDEINVEFNDNVLTISAETKKEKKEENDNYTRREFNFTSFKRSFTIPEDVDESKIEAKQEDGVLTINIPKTEAKASLKKMIKVA